MNRRQHLHRINHAILAVFTCTLAQTVLWYLPRLQGTDLAPAPGLAVMSLLVGLPIAVVAAPLHRWSIIAVMGIGLTALGGVGHGLCGLGSALVTLPLAARFPQLAVLVLALLSLFMLRPQPSDTVAVHDRPNIVLVVLDTVAASATSLQGGPASQTPNLAALAQRGMSFRNATSPAPWTVPAHAAMFTGLLPSEVNCHHEHPHLDASAQTTAEQMAASGYRTAAFVANPWVGDFNGLTQGFSHQEHHWQRAKAAASYPLLRLLHSSPSKGGASTVRAALQWLSTEGTQPAFVFINLLEAHSPFHHVPDAAELDSVDQQDIGQRMHHVQMYGPQSLPDFPRQGEVEQAEQLYAHAVHTVDDILGTLVDALPEDTILIVTSDHGEAFGEHGFYGHMIGLYQQTLHVPLVIVGPGIDPGVVHETVVSTKDIHATILALSGQDRPSLLDPRPAPVISEQFRPLQVLADYQAGAITASEEQRQDLDHRARRVRRGDTVLLMEGSRRTRFDLSLPNSEHSPLPLLGTSTGLLNLLPMPTAAPMESAAQEHSDDLRAQLRALGYLSNP